MAHPAQEYIEKAAAGKLTVCKWVELACQRHLKDLDNLEGYHFDQDEAQYYIDSFKLFKFHKGAKAGQTFELLPWLQAIIWIVYGWKREDGRRRFKKAYVEVARKNSKTTTLAALALIHLIIEDVNSPQIYVGATKEDQAKILTTDAGNLLKACDWTGNRFKVYEYRGLVGRIVYPERNGFIAPLGRDSKTSDGFDPSVGIIDEYHAHKTEDLLNVIESGMAARVNPLLWIITTAGFNKQGPCYNLRKVLTNILEGTMTDESFFGIIHTVDDPEKWEDEKEWEKANPNIDASVNREFLRDRVEAAKNEGASKEVDVKTKNLNIWTDSAITWIPADVWNQQRADMDESNICYAGLDLGSRGDFTAFVRLYDYGDQYFIKPTFWIPEVGLKEREKAGQPIRQWVNDGWLQVTPGNVTDYNFIQEHVINLKKPPQVIEFDAWNSTQIVTNLINEGANMEPFRQGFASMSAPCKEFERLVFDGKMFHDGNPVMTWMIGNVLLKKDPAGNIKIDKEKSEDKVDGPVAAVMALGGMLTNKGTGKSIYEDQDIKTL